MIKDEEPGKTKLCAKQVWHFSVIELIHRCVHWLEVSGVQVGLSAGRAIVEMFLRSPAQRARQLQWYVSRCSNLSLENV